VTAANESPGKVSGIAESESLSETISRVMSEGKPDPRPLQSQLPERLRGTLHGKPKYLFSEDPIHYDVGSGET
jgi:hypothetical protein